MITIVDYGLGNIKAFANIYRQLDIPCTIATHSRDLDGASHVILPGVGAFDQAMKRLQESGMRDRLDDLVLNQKVFVIGVCVGLQILMSSSEEGTSPGLGWIDGEVRLFRQPEQGAPLRVPHMGWNNVSPLRSDGLFAGLDADSRFYFLHSYFTDCSERSDVLAEARYGGEFACAVNRGNIYGVQFHPEKSHGFGIRLLKNFAEL